MVPDISGGRSVGQERTSGRLKMKAKRFVLSVNGDNGEGLAGAGPLTIKRRSADRFI
jgi:hypothetical protein